MYVPPLAFLLESEVLNLKPLDKKSQSVKVTSAFVWSAYNSRFTGFAGVLEESIKNQFATASVRFHITNRGLNPRYTKGPSALPLPV